MESLLTKIVSSNCKRSYADKPELVAWRIEAIDYQVGHQLSERYTMERPRFRLLSLSSTSSSYLQKTSACFCVREKSGNPTVKKTHRDGLETKRLPLLRPYVLRSGRISPRV
ncbi:hypothetical protein L1887_22818 [Cichorium endivia]|nr:hypothetical protein L1887_22818 [Cichorium endivia]